MGSGVSSLGLSFGVSGLKCGVSGLKVWGVGSQVWDEVWDLGVGVLTVSTLQSTFLESVTSDTSQSFIVITCIGFRV